MDYSPLGAVCRELDLMSAEDVRAVLGRLAEGGHARFGALALEMSLLDELGLARALAHQYGLNLVPEERLQELEVAVEVLERVPPAVIRRYQLVPVMYSEEHDVLTVVSHDPTNLLGQRALKERSGAAELRLFLAPRSAVQDLAQRLLGPGAVAKGAGDEASLARPIALPGARLERDLVLETDPRRLHALQRLDALEAGTTEFASDPDQVAWILGSSSIRRLVHRADLGALVAPYLNSWRRLRPGLRVAVVSSFGAGTLPSVDPRAAGSFYQSLLRFVLTAGETRDVDARIRAWRAMDLARAAAMRLGLSHDQVETVVLATMFLEMEQLDGFRRLADSLGPGQGIASRFGLAASMLQAFGSPYELGGLLEALEHRLSGGGPIGAHQGAELVYTVRHVVRRRHSGQVELATILGDSVHHHAPRVVKAVGEILRWESLHSSAPPDHESSHEVLVAVRDPILLTALELHLVRAGFGLVLASQGHEALRVAATRQPLCVVADLKLPKLGGSHLLEKLRAGEATRHLPVIFVAGSRPGPAASHVLEQGAEDVLTPPVELDLLVARLRRLAQQPAQLESAGVRGRLADLPLSDLLQTLSLGGRTARVRVQVGELQGELGLLRGQLCFASMGEHEGEPALRLLVSARKGDFRVLFGEEPGRRNLSGSSEWLLLEALRRADEIGA